MAQNGIGKWANGWGGGIIMSQPMEWDKPRGEMATSSNCLLAAALRPIWPFIAFAVPWHPSTRHWHQQLAKTRRKHLRLLPPWSTTLSPWAKELAAGTAQSAGTIDGPMRRRLLLPFAVGHNPRPIACRAADHNSSAPRLPSRAVPNQSVALAAGSSGGIGEGESGGEMGRLKDIGQGSGGQMN